jgi:hypothetical protein
MSEASIHVAGILLITVPAVAFVGARLLSFIWGRTPGYLDNPVRQNLWRAGHAHDGRTCSPRARRDVVRRSRRPVDDPQDGRALVLGRCTHPHAAGFFLSVASPRSERPNRLLALVPIGGLSLAIGAVMLGIGLVAA